MCLDIGDSLGRSWLFASRLSPFTALPARERAEAQPRRSLVLAGYGLRAQRNPKFLSVSDGSKPIRRAELLERVDEWLARDPESWMPERRRKRGETRSQAA